MNSILQYASTEDVISATEIVYENEYTEFLNSNIFGLDKALSFVNLGCILETDNVLLIGSHLDIASLLISYIFTPHKLLTINVESSCCYNISNELRDYINQLLSESKYTESISSNVSIDFIEHEYGEINGEFDVAIVGFANQINNSIDYPISRFHLETGFEFEQFEHLLKISSKKLKKDGRLVILSKPGWILKVWNLIHDHGLQLEYCDYSLHHDDIRNPNAFIWLRFVKREDDFDLDVHKKNILSLMDYNNIDRLYAHRNNIIFPYVEMSYNNTESYVTLDQQLEFMQYFFSVETTANLTTLCEGYTACLVTPSIAKYAYKLNKNVVLFERDNRFRENGGLKYVKYDLNIGLTKFIQNKYANKFDRVICDPPFDI